MLGTEVDTLALRLEPILVAPATAVAEGLALLRGLVVEPAGEGAATRALVRLQLADGWGIRMSH